MVNVFRLVSILAGPLLLAGCISTATAISDTHRLIAADPIQTEFPVTINVNGVATPVMLTPAAPPGYEKEYLGLILIDSGTKCQEFVDRLSTAQRGVDTSFDILSTILSALATAFTPLNTVHALTAGATISTGTKSAIASDVYAKATAPLIIQQIDNTYYTNIDVYRKEILNTDPKAIVPALEVSRIQAIHRQCSLDSAIASLSQAGTVTAASLGAISGAVEGAKTAQQKGLTPDAGAIAGAALGAAAGAAGPASTGPSAAATQGAAAAAIVGTAPPPGAVNPPIPGPSGAPPPFTPPAGPVILYHGPPPAKSPVIPTPLPTEHIRGANSDFEKTLFPSDGRKIQRALCLNPDPGAVTFGILTRQAIQMFRTTTTGQNITKGIPNLDDQGLTQPEGVLLTTTIPCDKQCYANAFEYFEYGPKGGMRPDLSIPADERQNKLKSLLELLAWAAKDQSRPENIKDFCDPATRNLITKALNARGFLSERSLSDAVVNSLRIDKYNEGRNASPTLVPAPR